MKDVLFRFQKIRLKSPAIYWTINVCTSFIIGLLFSLVYNTDEDRLICIGIVLLVGIVIPLLFGGYGFEKRQFENK